MDSIRYLTATSLLQNFRSLTWVHANWSSLIAFIHESRDLSREIPRTVKFLSLNLLNATTTFGFSIRHGLHQLAQKSSKTYLPRKEASDTGFPVVSFWVNSIAFVPTAP